MVNLQYLTDNIGNRNAVILSMADWYNIQKNWPSLFKSTGGTQACCRSKLSVSVAGRALLLRRERIK